MQKLILAIVATMLMLGATIANGETLTAGFGQTVSKFVSPHDYDWYLISGCHKDGELTVSHIYSYDGSPKQYHEYVGRFSVGDKFIVIGKDGGAVTMTMTGFSNCVGTFEF